MDELRAKLFHTKPLEKLPPTSDALKLHTQRAHFQAMVWKNALIAKPTLPLPEDHGWQKHDGQLQPVLMLKPAVPATCLELISCHCSKSRCSSTNCSCRKNKLPCTGSCGCIDTGCVNPANNNTDVLTDDDDDDA